MTISSEPRQVLRLAQLVMRLGEHIQATDAFRDVWVEGEISDARTLQSGYVYFTMKDGSVAMDAVLSVANAARLALSPRAGLRVLVHGDVRYYMNNGRCQLRVDDLRLAGAGDAWLRKEALKRQLQAEGLFAGERKRVLPAHPRRIGVVTSPVGAAWRDIQKVVAQRDPTVELILAAAVTQGQGAAEALVAALDGLRLIVDLDCVILARGGGGSDDLSAFDDVALARAIARFPVPLCTGIGHETDVTIADLVADVRAATPSNAAELVVPDGVQRRAAFLRAWRRIDGRTREVLAARRRQADAARRLLDRRSPQATVEERRQRLDLVFAAIERRGPAGRLPQRRLRVANALRRQERALARVVPARRERAQQARRRLEALSPLAVLGRGYAIVEGADGRVRPSVATVAAGEKAKLRMRDGRIAITVDEVRKDG